MLLSVSVLNPSNDELIMELTNPERSGFTIRKIDGIGPTKSNINIYDIPSIDGGLFNSARTQARQIIIKLGYMWIATGSHSTPLIEDARHLSYKYFPLKRKVRLEFVTDYRTLYIDGYIESNEPDIFSKDEVTTISIMCPDPNFYASDTEYGYINYPIKKFEVPFEDTSMTDPTIEFSEAPDPDKCSIDYTGDNITGVELELYFDDDMPKSQTVSTACINNIRSTSIDVSIPRIIRRTEHPIRRGDYLIINGRPGHKSAIYHRLGQTYNCFDAITLKDDWPQLYPGKNTIVFNAGDNTGCLRGRVIYNTLYDGV